MDNIFEIEDPLSSENSQTSKEDQNNRDMAGEGVAVQQKENSVQNNSPKESDKRGRGRPRKFPPPNEQQGTPNKTINNAQQKPVNKKLEPPPIKQMSQIDKLVNGTELQSQQSDGSSRKRSGFGDVNDPSNSGATIFNGNHGNPEPEDNGRNDAEKAEMVLKLLQKTSNDFQFRHIAAIPEEELLKGPRSSSMEYYRSEEASPGGKSAGDRLYFRCAHWEVTRCQIIGCARRLPSGMVGYYESGHHTHICKRMTGISVFKNRVREYDPFDGLFTRKLSSSLQQQQKQPNINEKGETSSAANAAATAAALSDDAGASSGTAFLMNESTQSSSSTEWEFSGSGGGGSPSKRRKLTTSFEDAITGARDSIDFNISDNSLLASSKTTNGHLLTNGTSHQIGTSSIYRTKSIIVIDTGDNKDNEKQTEKESPEFLKKQSPPAKDNVEAEIVASNHTENNNQFPKMGETPVTKQSYTAINGETSSATGGIEASTPTAELILSIVQATTMECHNRVSNILKQALPEIEKPKKKLVDKGSQSGTEMFDKETQSEKGNSVDASTFIEQNDFVDASFGELQTSKDNVAEMETQTQTTEMLEKGSQSMDKETLEKATQSEEVVPDPPTLTRPDSLEQETQTPDNFNEIESVRIAFEIDVEIEPEFAAENENRHGGEENLTPPQPKFFCITEKAKLRELEELAKDMNMKFGQVGNQVMFFHDIATLSLEQVIDGAGVQVIKVSTRRQTFPVGPVLQWSPFDWDQFVFAVRGRLFHFFQTPRAISQQSGAGGNIDSEIGSKQHVNFPGDELGANDFNHNFSLKNLLTNEAFEEIAQDLLIDYKTLSRGFSISSSTHNLQIRFEEYAENRAIHIQEFDGADLMDDVSWIKLEYSQFVHAVRGRVTKLIYGSPREPIGLGNESDEFFEDEEEEDILGGQEMEEEVEMEDLDKPTCSSNHPKSRVQGGKSLNSEPSSSGSKKPAKRVASSKTATKKTPKSTPKYKKRKK